MIFLNYNMSVNNQGVIVEFWDNPEEISKEYDFSKLDDFGRGSFHHLGILDFECNLDKAEEYYLKAEENKYVYNNLAILYYDLQKYEKSIDYFNRVLEMDSTILTDNSLDMIIHLYELNIKDIYDIDECFVRRYEGDKLYDIIDERYNHKELIEFYISHKYKMFDEKIYY